MSIARKPERKPPTQVADDVADAFIAGAAKAVAVPQESDPGSRKLPVMLRFDRELLGRVAGWGGSLCDRRGRHRLVAVGFGNGKVIAL